MDFFSKLPDNFKEFSRRRFSYHSTRIIHKKMNYSDSLSRQGGNLENVRVSEN